MKVFFGGVDFFHLNSILVLCLLEHISEVITAVNCFCLSVDCEVKKLVGLATEELYLSTGQLG